MNVSRASLLRFATALALFAAPAALRATDPSLDSAFVNTISPGLTPDSYVPLSITNPVPPDWSSGTGAVNAVALQSDGKIIAGGNISRYKAPPAGSAQTSLKRLNPDGSLDTTTSFNTTAATLFDSQGQTEINKILTVAGDKLYVGGVFTSYNGTARGGLMRLNADGSLDTAFATSGIGNSNSFGIRYVLALAEQPDGKLLVGGGFNRANGTYCPNLARFNSDGTLDASFSPVAALASSTFVGDIAVLPDGDIIVAGGLARAGGGSTPLLVRLNSDGSLDPSLAPAFGSDFGDIDELVVLPDGRILIGGDVSFLPSGTSYYFACLLPDGSLDTTFMTNVGSGPTGWAGGEIALQPDGTIFVGGIFTSWSGSPRASIARLQPNGSLDAAFAPPPHTLHPSIPAYGTHFYSFAFQPDGKLVAGGWFARVSDNAVETYNLTRFVNEYAPASPGTIRLVATSVSIGENQPSVTLQVSRFGGTTGAVTADFATLTGGFGGVDGNATSGVDFTSTSGTLSWAVGEGGLKTITVPLLTDSVLDGAKTFTVQLSNLTGGAFLPAPAARATVTIRDAEAVPVVTSQPASVSLEQGAAFTLAVRYDSVLAATVQWQRDPDGDGPLPFTDIPGAISTTYTVTNADAATHSGPYRAVLTNPNGTTTSATATVSISVPAGSVVTSFAPADNGSILLAAPDSSGRIVAYVNGTNLRRLSVGGVFEPTTSFGIAVSGVSAILAADDGRTYIGGNLPVPYTHQPSNTTSSVSTRLFRLNNDATGTIDTSFSVSTNGPVTALAAGASGKIYVGTSAAPTSTNGIQRFLSSGATDSTWTPAVNTVAAGTSATVMAIKELADGKVLISHRHGTTYRLSRLTSTGALDPTFGTGGNIDISGGNWITSFDVLPDGRIAFTARFNNTLFGSNQYLALLNADGSFDPTFQSGIGVFSGNSQFNPTGIAYRDGRLLVWGPFNIVNGVTQGNLARLNLDGSIDPTFSVGVGASGNFGFSINSAFYIPSGEIFIGGSFTSFKGVPRNRAALLVGNPQIGAIGFAPPRVSVVEGNTSLTLTLRRYGAFSEAASISWATANGTAVSGSDYTAASGTVSWAAGDNADKTISIPLLDDSAIESSESFTVALSAPSGPVGPAASATVTLIDSDTPVTFSAQPAGSALLTGGNLAISATATSPSPITYQWFRNGIALSGATAASFSKSGVTAADAGVYTLVATNASGSYTTTPVFVGVRPQPGTRIPGSVPNQAVFSSSQIRVIVPLPDGGAYIGGGFPSVSADGTYRYFARVKADLSLDTTFLPFPNNPNNNVLTALRQPDGKILVGGDFTQWAGQNINRLVRLNADGSLDTAFNTALGTGPAASVNAFALLPDGRIVVGGSFTGYQGDNYLTVLLSTGAPDTSFSSTASNGPVTKLAVRDVASQTRILAAGTFTNFSSANRLVLLNTDGTRDTTFTNAVTGATGTVNDLLVLSDGRILAAGSFGAFEISLTGTAASTLSSGQNYDFAEAPGGSIIGARTSGTSSLRLFRLKGTNPFPVPGSNDTDSVFATGIGSGPDTDPSAVAVGSDGVVWVGGLFSSFNGAAAGSLVKLYGDPINPSVINAPANFGAATGTTATFGVGAFGTGLSYQWLKDGTPLANGGDISGATSALLTIANADLSDQAAYSVEVTGGSPSTTVTSSSARLYILAAPVVATAPSAVDMFAGPALTISAEVFAASPATLQWTKDGVPLVNDARISGATTASLSFASTLASDTGTYTLTVTNAQGTATTSLFALVRPLPSARVATFSGLASASAVRVLNPLPDGRMLVSVDGGTMSNGASSSSAAALHFVNADGTVANLGTDPINAAKLPYITGQILATLVQPDGKILIGGTFTTVNGVTRNRVARLNPDGSLDTAFDPGTGPNSNVNTLALDASGRVLVGGAFTSFNANTSYPYAVRLNATTGALDTTWTPGIASGAVTKILALPSGGFLVGGGFFSPQSYLARYDDTGARVTTYNHAVNIAVTDLALTPNGSAFYASASSTPYVQRFILSTGALDTTYSGSAAAFNSEVQKIAVQPDGKVLAIGTFTSPAGRIARLLPTGALDTSFITAGGGVTTGTTSAIALDASGRVWVGGTFTTFSNVAATNIAVLEGDLPALAWTAQPLPLSAAAGQSFTFTAAARSTAPVTYQWFKDGSPLTNGGRISGATSTTLTITGATLADEGNYTARATTVPAGAITSVPAEFTFLAAPEIVALPTGRTAPAGTSFAAAATARGAGTLSYQWLRGGTVISGQTSAVLSLPAPATTDTGWYQLRVTNTLGTVTSAPVLFVFAQYAGSSAGGIAVPSINNTVSGIATLADGGAMIGGTFTQLTPPGGTAQNAFGTARLTSNGTVFAPAPQVHSSFAFFGTGSAGTVIATARDSQGRIIVTGNFDGVSIGGTGTARNSVVRFNADGTLDTTWNSPATSAVSSITCLAVDASDNIYLGGFFSNFAGVTGATRLVRLSATTGAVDTTFLASATLTSGTINAILPLSGGRVLAGGTVSAYLFESNATLASGFTYAGGNNVVALASHPAGGFLVGRTSASTLVRISDTGALVSPFPATGTAASGAVRTILPISGDRFVIAGSLTSYNGVSVGRIAVINADGTPNSSINFGTGFTDGQVNALALDAQNRLWVGGTFTTYRGVTTNRLAVLATTDFTPATPEPPVTATPFESFLTNANVPEGQRGLTDDPDGDSVPNLLEFALGLEPLIPDSDGLPIGSLDAGELGLTYIRAQPTAVTYQVVTTTDLVNGPWTAAGVDQGTPAPDGVTTATIPYANGPRYLRLSVTLNP